MGIEEGMPRAVENYKRLTIFRDPVSGYSFGSYAVEEFIIERMCDLVVLLISFVARAEAHADAPILEIQAYSISLPGAGPLRFQRCSYTLADRPIS